MMLCDERSGLRCRGLRRGAAALVVALSMAVPLPRSALAVDAPGGAPLSGNQPGGDQTLGDSIATEGGYAWPSRALGTAGRGATASVIYDHPFLTHFAFEVNLHGSIFQTDIPGGSNYYQKGLNLDLVYNLNIAPSFFVTPFVLVGIGGAYDDFNPETNDQGGVFLTEAGLGAVSRPLFGTALRLRIDARWVHDPNEGGHSEYRGMLGIVLPLGWSQPRAAPPPPATIEIREVIKEVVKEVSRPWVDSDGDGVDDEHDKCPNTPAGARVDASGCVIAEQTFELRGVTFNHNQATLTPNAESVLDAVVPAFVGQPSLSAEVGGHTDSIGSESYNLALSQRRAESVRAYLIAHGARPDQLTARGYGKSELLIDPEEKEGDRERNRRVELRARGQE
jgi:OmpA-OmpF porin, OOP family